MSAAPPTMPTGPTENAAEALSEPQRILNTFFAPSKTFADINRNASWWVPYVLAAVIGLGASLIVLQKIDLMNFAHQQIEQSKFAQQQFDQLTPAQQDQQLRIRATFSKWLFYASPVLQAIIGIVCAALFMAIFNFGFGAEVSFKQALAIIFYAALPGMVSSILLATSFMLSSDPSSINLTQNPIATNVGFFIDPANKFVHTLGSGIDIIRIWIMALIGLGFSLNSGKRKLSFGAAFGTIFGIYFVLILVGAAVSAIF